MKNSEFIELLNLYVDHEIGAEDAQRLEAEVATHAERRRLYRQYCMMHKACSLLASEREGRPVAVAERESGSGIWGWATGSGLLAAACVALVMVAHLHHGAVGAGTMVAGPAHLAAPVAVVASQSVREPATILKDMQPVFILPRSGAVMPAEGLLNAAPDPAIAWLTSDVKLSPTAPSAHDVLANPLLAPGLLSESPDGAARLDQPADRNVLPVGFNFTK
jgi:hypothetical protein